MFCKKLVLIAATAALALGSISAKQESKIHVRVHANSKAVCSAPGQSPMSVEGVEGVFCVTGQACVANISNGSCPGPQSGLPNGAVCGIVKTGVYGCKPAPATPQCTGNDVTPMSVEGVEGIFCVNGKACAGQDGACPGPQAGLPNGAFCGTVKTGVLGCKPKTAKHHKHKSASKAVCSGPGQSPMSVEGVEGVYCVTGQACVANINGACPGPQPGLPNGAVCGTVKTGVLGCKPAPAAPQCTGNDVTPMSVEGVEGIFCVNGKACAGQDGACPGPQTGLPNGAYCGTVKTGVLGCKPKTAKHHKHKSHKSSKSHAKNVCSGPGQSPMSVEGVPGVFCVTGQACVADISTGACPGPQDGLPNGAHCGKVITGVYGCQPNADAPKTEAPKTEAPKTEAPKTEAPKTEAPKTEAPKTEAPKVEPAVCSGPGQSPMSVEGVQGVFCVTGQACVADISTGSCPGPQEGLPNGAHCGKVKTGVYGCKPNTDAPKTEAPKTEAPKTEAPKAENVLCSGPGQSPMSVEGVQGIYCVTGQACVANIANGACPGPQEGLPNGAYCGKVKTGVYGCKPTADAPTTEPPKTEAPKTEAPKTEAPKTEAPKTEAPKTEAPKIEAPKTEAPKAEAPVVTSAPPTHAPKTHTPKTHTPKTLTPVVTSAPTTHAPKTHAPASNPSDNHGVVIVDIDVDVNGEDSDDSEDSSDVVYVEDSADSEDSEDSSDSSDDRRL